MASGPRAGERERTLAFYEIVKVASNGVTTARMSHVDWESALKALKDMKLGQRVHEGPTRTLVGEVMLVDDQHHLKLMKVRDRQAWLSVFRPDAESIAALDLGDGGVLLEESIVCFLDYGNIIGLV